MLEQLETEITAVLERAAREHCGFSETDGFLRETALHYSAEHLTAAKPDVIVLGEDIPQELVWACSKKPWFILGGSLETTRWSDSLVPRDADPVSRSALGWLLNDQFHLAENALVVLALSSDNRRKLAGLLRRHGVQTAAVDMPPRYDTESDRKAWVEGMLRLTEEISAHIRAFHPWSKTFFEYKNKFFIPNPYALEIIDNNTEIQEIGEIMEKNHKENSITVVCGDGKLLKMSKLNLYGHINKPFTSFYIKKCIKEHGKVL